MAKNIVVCCDGTGNEYGSNNTNVVKLYEAIVRDRDQAAFYDPGVGTFSFLGGTLGRRVGRTLGKAFGASTWCRTRPGSTTTARVTRWRPGSSGPIATTAARTSSACGTPVASMGWFWGRSEDARADHQTIEQVWFAGVHSDVGGWYTDAGLSDIALEWMLNRARARGLRLRQDWRARLSPDPAGRLHVSRAGFWRLWRPAPRSIPGRRAHPQEAHADAHGRSETIFTRHRFPSV